MCWRGIFSEQSIHMLEDKLPGKPAYGVLTSALYPGSGPQ